MPNYRSLSAHEFILSDLHYGVEVEANGEQGAVVVRPGQIIELPEGYESPLLELLRDAPKSSKTGAKAVKEVEVGTPVVASEIVEEPVVNTAKKPTK